MEVQAPIRGGMMLLDPHAPPGMEQVGDLILDLDLDGRRSHTEVDAAPLLDDLTLSALQLAGLGDSFQLVFGGVGLLFAALLRRPMHARVAETWVLPWNAVRMAILDVMEVERYSAGVSLVGPPPTDIRLLESAAVPPSTRSIVVQRLEYDDAPVIHGMIGAPGFPALAFVPSPEKAAQGHPPTPDLPEPAWRVGDQALAVVRGAVEDGITLRLGSVESGVRGFLRTATPYERNLHLRVRLDALLEDGVWRVTPAVMHL